MNSKFSSRRVASPSPPPPPKRATLIALWTLVGVASLFCIYALVTHFRPRPVDQVETASRNYAEHLSPPAAAPAIPAKTSRR